MKPNILFLVFDSFRADKFYGKDKTSKTPNIDSILKSSTYFNQAIASADGTILSLNSIFTGLFPYVTGTRAIKLAFKNKNYVQSLQEFGYNIYGIMPNLTSLSPLYNLCLNDTPTYRSGPPAESLFDGVGSKIITVFSQMKEPWFYYVHVMDLHWPLTVPKQYDDSQYGLSKYDKIISSVDYWLGKILDHVDLKNTIVIITADHGTHIPINDRDVTSFEPSFNTSLKVGKRLIPTFAHRNCAKLLISLRQFIRDRRLKQANKNLSNYEKRSRLPYFTLSLFDESIHVPMLFTGYNTTHRIVTQQVRSVDIFPTIADIIKLPYEEKTHGKSLVPLFNGNPYDELPVYLHTIPYQDLSPGDAVGIRTSKYKYFRGSRDSSYNINLYDLKNDPFENDNIAKSNLPVVVQMEAILNEIMSTIKKYPADISMNKEKTIRNELKKRIAEKKSNLFLQE